MSLGVWTGVQERVRKEKRAFQFAKNSIHSARAAAAGHRDVEFVGVFRHGRWLLVNDDQGGLRMAG